MKQKSKLIALSAVVMSMSMSMSIFADNPVGWKQTNGTWQYVKDASGSVYSNGWQWIDGKCYYFDANGNMLSNTSTPDGYYVNGDGQWVYQNVVQTKEQYDKEKQHGFGEKQSGGWMWIDADGDGTRECYYFDTNDGHMYVSTTTPDGYTVNEKGQWTENGIVQTKTRTNITNTQTNENADNIPAYDPAGYLPNGLSKTAFLMANNTRDQNKVYGEIRVVTPDEYLTYIARIEAGEIEPGALRGTGSGLTVYYKNGFCVYYPKKGTNTNKTVGTEKPYGGAEYYPGTLIYKYFDPTIDDGDAKRSIFKAHGAPSTQYAGQCGGLMPHSTLYWSSASIYRPAFVDLEGGGYDYYDRSFNLVSTTRADYQQEIDMIRQQYGF